MAKPRDSSLSAAHEGISKEVPTSDRLAKIQALSSLNINPKAKGTWFLITAGFTWKETHKILHVSEATIRDVLAGKELTEE